MVLLNELKTFSAEELQVIDKAIEGQNITVEYGGTAMLNVPVKRVYMLVEMAAQVAETSWYITMR